MAGMIDGALEALGERQSTWRPAELVRELAAQVPTNVTVEPDRLCGFLQDLANHVAADRCVDLSPPVPSGAVLRRDGRPISEAAVDRALTTQAILEEEERIVEWAQRQRRFADIINTTPRGLDTRGLSAGQAEACRAAAGGAPLELIVGPAGSGKTTALSSRRRLPTTPRPDGVRGGTHRSSRRGARHRNHHGGRHAGQAPLRTLPARPATTTGVRLAAGVDGDRR